MPASCVTRSKVFGVGLSRTGTTSLTVALRRLGYRTVHYPNDPTTQAELLSHYAVPRSTLALTVMSRLDAITDTPVASVFRELALTYPESRFILTVREENRWLESCSRFFEGVAHDLYDRWPDSPAVSFGRQVNMRLYGTDRFAAPVFRDAYRRHVAEVSQVFAASPERLLVLDICAGEGWQALCGFLGCDCPDEPFPAENTLSAAERTLLRRRIASERQVASKKWLTLE